MFARLGMTTTTHSEGKEEGVNDRKARNVFLQTVSWSTRRPGPGGTQRCSSQLVSARHDEAEEGLHEETKDHAVL
jgi:hypothetical protein